MQRSPSPTRVPLLTVSMVDGVVVIRPQADIDLDATDTLRHAVAAAIAGGDTAMLALDEAVASAPSEWPHPVSPRDDEVPQGCAAHTVAAGYVRLCAGDEYWTLDLVRQRFCRSATAVDPHFVRSDQWTSIVAVWITAGRTTVLTERGTYVSTTSNWSG